MAPGPSCPYQQQFGLGGLLIFFTYFIKKRETLGYRNLYKVRSFNAGDCKFNRRALLDYWRADTVWY